MWFFNYNNIKNIKGFSGLYDFKDLFYLILRFFFNCWLKYWDIELRLNKLSLYCKIQNQNHSIGIFSRYH